VRESTYISTSGAQDPDPFAQYLNRERMGMLHMTLQSSDKREYSTSYAVAIHWKGSSNLQGDSLGLI